MTEVEILSEVMGYIVDFRGLSALRDIAEAHGRERRKSTDVQITELASFFTTLTDLVNPKSGWSTGEWNELLECYGFDRRKSFVDVAAELRLLVEDDQENEDEDEDDEENEDEDEDADDEEEEEDGAVLAWVIRDLPVSEARDDSSLVKDIATVTRLDRESVKTRIRETRGNTLIRNCFADEWPKEVEPLSELAEFLMARIPPGQSKKFKIAKLVELAGVGKAELRLTVASMQKLGGELAQEGYDMEPDLRRLSVSPGMKGQVALSRRGEEPEVAQRSGSPTVNTKSFETVVPGEKSAELFPFQLAAHRQLDVKLSHEGRSGLLVLPTGGGKTKTAVSWLISRFVDRGKRVLWLACAEELLDQAASSFRGHADLLTSRPSFTIGVVKASSGPEDQARTADVVIASMPTVSRRGLVGSDFRQGRKDLDVVVFDEAHHAPANTYYQTLSRLGVADRIFLGLTATPTRTAKTDRARLESLFNQGIVHLTTYVELMREGILARPLHRLIDLEGEQIDVSKWEREIESENELPPGLLSKLASDVKRTLQIVAHVEEHRDDYKPMLVFAVNLAHAKQLTEQLVEAGVNAKYLDGETPKGERRKIIEDLKTKKLDALVNVGVLMEGTDIPQVKSIVITRPTMSETLYTQMVGRGSRGPAVRGGTTEFHVVDFVDNFSKFGDRLAHRYVLDGETFVETTSTDDAAGKKAPDLKTMQGADLGPAVQRAIEALMREARGSLMRGTADFVEFQVAGWLRWPDENGGSNTFEYMPFFKSDEKAVRSSFFELGKSIRRGTERPRAHDLAKGIYGRGLFGTAVPSWKWLAVADALRDGHQVLVETYEAPSAPDLTEIRRELDRLPGRAGGQRLLKLWRDNSSWRLFFRTFEDFSSGVYQE